MNTDSQEKIWRDTYNGYRARGATDLSARERADAAVKFLGKQLNKDLKQEYHYHNPSRYRGM